MIKITVNPQTNVLQTLPIYHPDHLHSPKQPYWIGLEDPYWDNFPGPNIMSRPQKTASIRKSQKIIE